MSELSSVYAQWFVLDVIVGRSSAENVEIVYAIYGGPGFDDYGTVPSRSQQLAVLEQLRAAKVIRYSQEYSDGAPVTQVFRGLDAGVITQERHELVVLDLEALRARFAESQTLKRQEDERLPVTIVYDVRSGMGTIDGREFSVTRKNKQLFDALYAAKTNGTEWVQMSGALRAIGAKPDKVPKKADALNFSTAVTNLRRAAGLSKHQLQIKNGAARINGEIIEASSK